MWQLSAMIALDLARERAREAQAEADRHRLLRQAAVGQGAVRQGPVRAMLASVLRRLSGAADVVAEVACRAASRLDGQTV